MRFDHAAVRLYYGAGDSKAKPCIACGARPGKVPAIKAVEYVRQVLRRDARPGVLHFKAHLAEWMMACGKRGVLTFVDYGNWPSLRTHLRFGFHPTESVIALRVIGLRLFRKAS